jgi:hypothetical protein
VQITFIRYVQNQKIGNPYNLNVLGAITPKSQNRIAEFGLGLRETHISFINYYIIKLSL